MQNKFWYHYVKANDSTHFCLIPYWSSELPITLRLKDGVYGEAGNNFSLRQSLFEHQTAPHFYDKIKSPAFLHILYTTFESANKST